MNRLVEGEVNISNCVEGSANRIMHDHGFTKTRQKIRGHMKHVFRRKGKTLIFGCVDQCWKYIVTHLEPEFKVGEQVTFKPMESWEDTGFDCKVTKIEQVSDHASGEMFYLYHLRSTKNERPVITCTTGKCIEQSRLFEKYKV